MCGIAGLWTFSEKREQNEVDVKKMASALEHRGPDNCGFWSDIEHNLYLSHRRLSILDLSSAGSQPMKSHNDRYVITFNGEIYNNLDLRKELETVHGKINWRGHSDTEILLELISYFGLEKALLKCSGMFALALWDRNEKCLKLARDRMGEKPLYYGFSGAPSKKTFLFGSELSALRKWKNFNNSINPIALRQLINYQVISAPNSIFEGIFQLLPGHTLTLKYPKVEYLLESKPWWDLKSTVERSLLNPILKKNDAIKLIENTLKDSIKNQSIADVPLGTFLSGGIDSSLITALLQTQTNLKVKTFTIGFEESKFNEAPDAKKIANFLETDHSEIYLTSTDAQKIIPRLNKIYSEPFADASQIPTHLVCKEASQNGLKVALSGDGGDELFGGYNRYLIAEKIWKKIDFLPLNARKLMGAIGLKMPTELLNSYSNVFGINKIGTKIVGLSERLKYIRNDDEFYHSLISLWNNPNVLLKEDLESSDFSDLSQLIRNALPQGISKQISSKMMFYDSLNYLPNDILTKVDRASMSTSLETRAPFLDYKVVECAWRIGTNLKIKSSKFNNSNKWILRQILYKYIPKELIERPKSGFGIPISEWLRGPLKEWANDLLSEDSINDFGYLQFHPISNLWKEHLSCKFDHSSKLWSILMWQSWLDNNKVFKNK